jgi:hypothetical protein
MIPSSEDAIKLSVGLWYHVVNSKGTSLIKNVYDTIINSYGWYSSKIKLLFDKIRFGHVWENQNTFSKNRLTFFLFAKFIFLCLPFSIMRVLLLILIVIKFETSDLTV